MPVISCSFSFCWMKGGVCWSVGVRFRIISASVAFNSRWSMGSSCSLTLMIKVGW